MIENEKYRKEVEEEAKEMGEPEVEEVGEEEEEERMMKEGKVQFEEQKERGRVMQEKLDNANEEKVGKGSK